MGSVDSTVQLEVEVANTGEVTGDETVLVYTKPPRSFVTLSADVPIVQKQLVAFQRVHVSVGGKTNVSFRIKAAALGLADETGAVKLHPGEYKLLLPRSHGKDLEASVSVAMSKPALLKPFRKWWSDKAPTPES